MTGPQIRKSRSENEKKYAYAAQLGAWAGQAVMMYLAGRARLVGEISPFAPALMAAGIPPGPAPTTTKSQLPASIGSVFI